MSVRPLSPRPLIMAFVPSLRISGGNKEIVRLLQETIAGQQAEGLIVSMWKHSHEVDTGGIAVVHLTEAAPVGARALVQMPGILLAFRRFLAGARTLPSQRLYFLLGHYATYPLAWMAPSVSRICFNQDLEWLFVKDGWRRSLLKRLLLWTNRRSTVVTSNAFVTESYRAEGVEPLGEVSIWAERRWLGAGVPAERDIDVLMLLRESPIKRLDLYREALHLLRTRTSVRVAAITPDTSIAKSLRAEGYDVHLRPTDEQMQRLFEQTRIFLLLSDVEGFGLPPLEAMGSGCVPVCRDSGGVRCYMRGEFAQLLFDRSVPVTELVEVIERRLGDGSLPGPEAAQLAFAAGLEAALASRADCVKRLQDMIGGGSAGN